MQNIIKLITITFLSVNSLMALPMNWSGSISFDTNVIGNFRRASDTCTPGNGSYCIEKTDNNARFQTSNIRLNPSLILSDAATLHGEIATSGNRNQFAGQDNAWNGNGSSSYYNIYNNGSGLGFNQLYLELFADTATFKIGKFTQHFGMGALINEGSNPYDRYYSLYDGIQGAVVIGNLTLTPYWAKIYSDQSLPTGRLDVREYGLQALYDNKNIDLKFGALYSVRQAGSNSAFFNGTGVHNANLIDIYLNKNWNNYTLELEVPMLTGKAGSSYSASQMDFDASAYIIKAGLNTSSDLSFNLIAGNVSGDDSSTNAFEAMYLHPNFQIAKIMFHYNYEGFVDPSQDIFDSSISNAQFLKFNTSYKSGFWHWNFDLITATAAQTASSGQSFYNHENGETATAVETQNSNMGFELDISFDYEWNRDIFLSAYWAYYSVGDFYQFDNDTSNSLDTSVVNSFGLGISTQF